MLAFTYIKCPSLIEPNICNYIVHTSDSVCTTIIMHNDNYLKLIFTSKQLHISLARTKIIPS